MENWVTRLNSRTKREPIYPSISQKLHWQPEVSFRRHFRGDGSFLNCRGILQSPIPTLPALFKGSTSASSVETPAPASAFVGSPLEKPEVSALLRFSTYMGILTMASAPFERVKLLMQNQNAMIKSGRLSQPYNGILNCFATTIRTEGFFSLWRACIAMTIGTISSAAISRALNEYFASHGHWNYVQAQAANGLVTAGTQFLVYPFLYAGTRMANDVLGRRRRQFNGMFDVFRKTLKSDGIAGLYRGYNLSLAQIGMTTMVASALMPWQEYWMLVLQDNLWGMVALTCGLRVCRNLAAYPLDTVSKRMMMSSGEAVKYKSSLYAFKQILRTEGLKSLYKGAGADIVLNVAVSGVQSLLIQLAVILIAAMEKPEDIDDEDSAGFTLTISWKKPR